MKIIIKALMTLALVLAIQSPTQAQSSRSSSSKKIFFTCASWDQMNDELYCIKGGSERNPEYQKVGLSVMTRSIPYEIRSSGSLTFYTKSAAGYTKAATAKLPSGGKRYLLLFMPKEDNKHQVRVLADDRSDSPFGAYSFYNFSKLPVKGMIGNKKFVIDSGKKKLVALNMKPGTSMPYATFTEVEGKKQWLQRNTFHYNPNKHLKYFLYQVPTTNGRVKVKAKAIVEFQSDKPALTKRD